MSVTGVALLLAIEGCASSGAGGGSGTGGSTGTGGAVSTGGSVGTGGSSSTGGSTDTGGSSGTGGSTGTGGAVSTGGAIGNAGTGGSSTGTGGSIGSGGGGGSNSAQPTVVTSAQNAYWTTSGALTMTTSGNANVTVNDSSSGQTWQGFGGAINEMGWNFLTMLSSSDQAKAMDLLFGSDAAHFGMARIPIGASDYALQRYTDDETSSSADTSLASFSISQDMKYLIPYAKAALAINPSLRFWASPWTPPTWMKTRTGSVNGTSCGNPTWMNMTDPNNVFDGGCMQDISANETALANYFIQFIQQYAQAGINIDTLAPQNEPNYAQGYPSCLWDPKVYAKFVGQVLAPALSQMLPNVQIMLGTMSNGDNGASSKDLQVVQAVMSDSTAKSVPKVMGLQWGMLDLYEGKSSGVGPSNFMTGSMPVWATEHRCGNYPFSNQKCGDVGNCAAYVEPAPNDFNYGLESWSYIRDAIKGGVSAYNAWNMVLDTVGKGNDLIRQWSQDALLVVNTSSKALVITPAYYVFRHVSQFTQIGAHVLTTTDTSNNSIAFKNPDGSEVAIMYNSGSASTFTVAISGAKYQFTMPSKGWATVFVPAH